MKYILHRIKWACCVLAAVVSSYACVVTGYANCHLAGSYLMAVFCGPGGTGPTNWVTVFTSDGFQIACITTARGYNSCKSVIANCVYSSSYTSPCDGSTVTWSTTNAGNATAANGASGNCPSGS